MNLIDKVMRALDFEPSVLRGHIHGYDVTFEVQALNGTHPIDALIFDASGYDFVGFAATGRARPVDDENGLGRPVRVVTVMASNGAAWAAFQVENDPIVEAPAESGRVLDHMRAMFGLAALDAAEANV